jgi:UDP-glucose 4-epimerase
VRGTEMILVTGGAGYVGSHCVRALVELGYEVVVLDNLSQGRRDAVLSQHFVEGDLLDTEALKRTFAAYPIDVVLHFAGLICVGESMRARTLLRAQRGWDDQPPSRDGRAGCEEADLLVERGSVW